MGKNGWPCHSVEMAIDGENAIKNNNTNFSFYNVPKTLKFKLMIGKLIKYI